MRERVLLWCLALCGGAVILAVGADDVWWSDFGNEALPAFRALADEDFGAFVDLTPAYVGSLVLRVPFAGPVGWLGGGDTALFVAGAIPCLLPLSALGVGLARHARRLGATPLAAGLVVVLGATSPLAGAALDLGHPEELLASALSVAAVLAARDGRTLLAAALLGVAVVSKQWAVLAAAPVLLLTPVARWPHLVLAAAAAGGAVLLPVVLADPGHFLGNQVGVAATTGPIFHPRQIWWPLGVPVAPGQLEWAHMGRMAPAWLLPVTHPLIVALALPLGALWRRGRGPALRPDDALLLLALLFLLRCALDPWNLAYYHLPFVLALLAWEVRTGRALPLVTLAATAAIQLSFAVHGTYGGSEAFLAYMAWVVPMAAWMGMTVYRPRASLVGSWPAAPISVATPSSPSTSPT